MGRKLRTLMVGILAFALANSLQSSLATNESSENRQKCVAEVADQLAKIEVTESVKVLMEKLREYYSDHVALVEAGGPSFEYLSALRKIGPQDDCVKVVSDVERIVSEGCLSRFLSDTNELGQFVSELVQVSQEVEDAFDAYKTCVISVENQYPDSEDREKCTAEVADYVAENIKISEPLEVFMEKGMEFYSGDYETQDVPEGHFEAMKNVIVPHDDCKKLKSGLDKIFEIECVKRTFYQTDNEYDELLFDLAEFSENAYDILNANFLCQMMMSAQPA
jgi:hypothetical protein